MDTPWLDDEEMRIWRAFLESSGRVMQHLGDAMKSTSQLSLDDYEVLVLLTETPDRRLRMTELSEKLLNSQSRLSQRIDRLSARGLVCREKCPSDRRGTFACLTDKGAKTIEELAPSHVAEVRRWLIDLIEPNERAMLANVLERIAEAGRSDS